MERKMFYEADAIIFHYAGELRSRLTDAEKKLWLHLRSRPGGYKFRRQHPAGNYILDFYCHALQLAIEADGEFHNGKDVMQADVERQKNLEAAGIKFIRFTNEEITNNLNSVIEKINLVINQCIKAWSLLITNNKKVTSIQASCVKVFLGVKTAINYC